jgi:hypothetical protein
MQRENAEENASFRDICPYDPTVRNASTSPVRVDPIAVALRTALDRAIAEGRTADAAAIAGELAARGCAADDPKVVPLADRRR